jgi:hypothetical protein
MASPRTSAAQFNFDGLTDSITNLAGSLILLVLIVFALTTPKEVGSQQPSSMVGPSGADVPMGPLVEKIQAMNSDVDRLEQQTRRIEDRLPQLTTELEKLKRKTQ